MCLERRKVNVNDMYYRSKGINSPTPSPPTPNHLLTESLGHKPQVQATNLILSRLDLSLLVHGPAVVWNDLHSKYTVQGEI